MKHEPVILIVDSKEIYDEMAPVLSKALNTTYIIHVDSFAAAESIIDSHIKFDIIFSDWQLAGAKFLDEVRREGRNDCTPVVVMSELDDDRVIATATRHGANAFLAKPFLTKGLIGKVTLVLTRQERRRKTRLVPDYPISVSVDTESSGPVEGTLIDFSLECTHICFNKSQKRELLIDDGAVVHLHIDDYKIDLESRLIRIGLDVKQEDCFSALFAFDTAPSEHMDSLEALLDEYQSKW